MRKKIQKLGQTASATPTPAQPALETVDESSFTKSNFATSVHQFLQGMNDFASLGMISKGAPSVLSGLVGVGNQIFLANIGSNYLQRELSLGIYNNKKRKDEYSASADTIISSFSTSVASRIISAFNKFSNFIKYSEELLELQNISEDPAVVDEFSKLKEIIIRKQNNSRELIKQLSNLIVKISEILEKIKNIAGVNFFLIKQIFNLDSAVSVNLDIDINTFSKDRYDLNNLPPELVNKLTPLLKELKNLQYVIEMIKDISNEYPMTSAVLISQKSKNNAVSNSSTTSGSQSSSLTIDGISSTTFFNQDAAYSYKLSGLASSDPSISLNLSGKIIGQSNNALSIFNILVKTKQIIINDGSGMSNPPPALAYITNQLMTPNSGLLSLNQNKNNYILTISIPIIAARQLIGQPSISIFTFVISNQNYIIKSANNKYIYNSDFSEISFNINDLIDDSSNISKIDRQKILNKLKK